MMKTLNILIVGIISVLILMSIIALISIHWTLSANEFKLTPAGLDFYLSAFGQYKALFTGTIATCAAYFGLLRVKVSEDANKEKIKQDTFSEWKLVVQVRSSEVEKYDPLMIREIIRIRKGIFNDLYESNFKIQDLNELTNVFNKHIKDLVRFFESHNRKCQGMGEAYRDSNHCYSFDSFRFILFGMLEDWYDSLEQDLRNLYVSNLDPNRIINTGLYQAALSNYKPI